MGFRTRTAVALVTALAGLTMLVAPAGSAAAVEPYMFPSTNEINKAEGWPHANLVSTGPGTVTLEFVNDTKSVASFEYRVDGISVGTTPHPVVHGDVIEPDGTCIDGRDTDEPFCSTLNPVVRTFSATSTIEVRLALGGERDWDFDWTLFQVGEVNNPVTKDDCKKGGWKDFGFRNQGQCIRFVNTGKDSR